MNMSSKLILIAALSASILGAGPTACGDPCLPTIGVDTLITPAAGDACFITTDDITSGGDSGSGAITTGDVCEAPLVDVFICAAMPSVGEMWGPCADGLVCSQGATCINGSAGNVCAPSCDDCGCPNLGCFGGTCNAGASPSCVPACEAAGDPCPVVGMECAPDVGACVWPGGGNSCPSGIGEMWGPCKDGACEDGAECIFFATADICAPTCLGLGTTCDADECGPQSAIATCNPVDGHDGGLCTQECMSDIDCAAGQSCTEQGCLWLK